MKTLEQTKATDEYNKLVEKYLELRRQADIIKDRIQQIEGLVEYEQ